MKEILDFEETVEKKPIEFDQESFKYFYRSIILIFVLMILAMLDGIVGLPLYISAPIVLVVGTCLLVFPLIGFLYAITSFVLKETHHYKRVVGLVGNATLLAIAIWGLLYFFNL